MPHDTTLIATIVAGLGLAFLLGTLANRLRLSPLVGYLLAGVVIGPFTPGYVADQQLANQLAEIGVILLMFGVGLHFSLADLMAVRAIALPGALVQIAIATLLGMSLGWSLGWTIGAGLVFGLALSVASTVVLLRALQERRLVETERGRIAVGWLIVEDLVMVLTLVLLPAVAGLLGGRVEGQPVVQGGSALVAWLAPASVWGVLALTLLKVSAFVLVMLVIGRRAIPGLLHHVAHTGSRELFRLAVLAIALGVAFGSAALFGVSFALGAFFAGMILAESPLSNQAARETLPLRDAFAVLFFVSVGMLFDPAILIREPALVLATLLIIVLGKSLAAMAIVRAFGHPWSTTLTISASLAQIGEFSFILVGLGAGLGLLPPIGRDLVLAGAILSILLNPFLFVALDRLDPRLRALEGDADEAEKAQTAARQIPTPSRLQGHGVIVGYGRVGSLIGHALQEQGVPFLVIEESEAIAHRLMAEGVETILGNAGQRDLLVLANVASARWLVSAIPDPFEAGNLIEQSRAANPGLQIIARAHTDAQVELLERLGADAVILGEREIAREMVRRLFDDRTAENPLDIHPGDPADGDAFEQARRSRADEAARQETS